MTWQHLRTILWLQWRLTKNQISRMEWGNRILLYALIALAILFGGLSLLISALIGIWVLPSAWHDGIVLATDGMVIAFLISWMIGVLNDLQRSEPLSLDKFLHLPISPGHVFVLNYASSFFSLSLVIFAPMMLSWSVVLAWKYAGLLWLGPLLTIAFFLMVTGLTHQFRGWLATLMTNKRRRRTIVTILTLGVVLISQIPNILDRTLLKTRETENRRARTEEQAERVRLALDLEAGTISAEEHGQRIATLDRQKSERRQQNFKQWIGWTRAANAYIPPLWLAAGLDNAARNRWPFAALSLIGLSGVGCFALFRSYQTTLRLYRGGFERVRQSKATPDSKASAESPDGIESSQPEIWRPNWIERSVPGTSQQQATVAWMSWQNMIRAPEVKLAMVIPIAVVILIGVSMYYGRNQPVAPNLRPLMGLGVCFVAMIGVSQLIQNQFGFDREGFRAMMLAPVSERDILIGKNLSLAPIALTLGLLALVALQLLTPLSFSHFLATVIQLVTMYLVACLVGNLMSIVVPQRVAPGSMKPTNITFAAVVLQLLIFLLAPLGMLPAVAPLGVEILLADSPGWSWLPIYLLGALFYLLVLGLFYRWTIARQAKLLAARKWRILETVTATT